MPWVSQPQIEKNNLIGAGNKIQLPELDVPEVSLPVLEILSSKGLILAVLNHIFSSLLVIYLLGTVWEHLHPPAGLTGMMRGPDQPL